MRGFVTQPELQRIDGVVVARELAPWSQEIRHYTRARYELPGDSLVYVVSVESACGERLHRVLTFSALGGVPIGSSATFIALPIDTAAHGEYLLAIAGVEPVAGTVVYSDRVMWRIACSHRALNAEPMQISAITVALASVVFGFQYFVPLTVVVGSLAIAITLLRRERFLEILRHDAQALIESVAEPPTMVHKLS